MNVSKPILAVTIPWNADGAGGAETVMTHVLNALVDFYEIHVIAISTKEISIKPSILSNEIRFHSLVGTHARETFFPLIKQFRQIHPDLILANVVHVCLLSILANYFSMKRVPIISVNHGMHVRSILSIVQVFFVCVFSKKTIVVSAGIKQFMVNRLRLPAKKIEVILNGVDVAEIQRRAKEPIDEREIIWDTTKKTIIFVGRFEEAKSLDILLRAVSLIVHTYHQDLQLLLVGDGDERVACERLVRTLDISRNVFFLGWKSNPFPFMVQSNVLVLSSSHEGLPTVLLEALALGMKIVSTDCPTGPSEILECGTYGTLVSVGDADVLARAIIETLDKPLDREQLVKRAWNIGQDQANQYQKILSASCRHTNDFV